METAPPLRTWASQSHPNGDSEVVLEARDVSFSYAGGDPAVEDVSFALRRGEFVALAGPNGSGKSTLLRMLVGLLEPQHGVVRVFGVDPRRLRDRWRLGYVPQRPKTAADLPATVREVVASGRLARRGWWKRHSAVDDRAVRRALDAAALTELADRRLSQLSVGQQQRAFIAKALVTDPQLLLLDEPIAGVDAESQALFCATLTRLVRRHRTAVLLVSHELSAVADALDRVILLKRRIVSEGPPTLLAGTGLTVHAAHPSPERERVG